MTPVVGDIFRGLGLKRAADLPPIEPLDRDSLCARVGLHPDIRPVRPQTEPPMTYLRIDGPQPERPRTWRAGPEGTAR
jgi:hypothetical protein